MSKRWTKKSLPKNINDLNPEQLAEILHKKKECNSRALDIVQSLSDKSVDEKWMLKHLFYINQSHYDDIVTERSIYNMCGYPTCVEMLVQVPRQQYRISLSKKSVFDITERKKFCSNHCFRASEFLKAQLLTSPLWFRDSEISPVFKILPKQDVAGSADRKESRENHCGNPVNLTEPEDQTASENSQESTKSVPSETKVNDNKSDKEDKEEKKPFSSNENSPAKCSGVIKKSISTNPEDVKNTKESNKETNIRCKDKSYGDSCDRQCFENLTTAEATGNSCQRIAELELAGEKSQQTNDVEIVNSEKINSAIANNADSVTDSIVTNKEINLDPVSRVEKSLEEWFTFKTYAHLLGKEKLKEEFSRNEDMLKSIKEPLPAPSAMKSYDRISQLCSLLDLGQDDENDAVLQPLPDYSVLRADSQNLTLKVKAFFSGQLEMPMEPVSESSFWQKTESTVNDRSLPLVDSHAQTALRRRIVLDRLNRLVPDVCVSLGVEVISTADLRALVHTFALAAHNVTFKPREGFLLAAVIIKLLALKDKALASNLLREDTITRMTLLLMSYNLPCDYLDNLMEWITDTERLTRLLRT